MSMVWMGKRGKAVLVLVAICMLTACDPLTVHKVTSTIFDGVPSMPPPGEYCRDYHEQALLEERATEKKRQQAQNVTQESKHPPFVEKRCNDCHDKNTDSGFVVVADKLCAHCHTGYPEGSFLHGPAAVGACIKCHVPHTSSNPSLLVKPRGEICAVCHTESRVAKGLHATTVAKGMACTDCHNPHGGSNRYFLR
jgi:predicted CXXCH cytochrome family protein